MKIIWVGYGKKAKAKLNWSYKHTRRENTKISTKHHMKLQEGSSFDVTLGIFVLHHIQILHPH